MELRSIEAIFRALNDAGVKYLVVGGLAVNAHGYQRTTGDLDLVIGLQPKNILLGLATLQSIGYEISVPITAEQFSDAAQRETWRREKNMVVLRLWSDKHSGTPVDVFVYEPFDFEAEFAAAEWQELESDLRAPVVRLHTLRALKLGAGRLQDLADVEALDEIQRMRDCPEP